MVNWRASWLELIISKDYKSYLANAYEARDEYSAHEIISETTQQLGAKGAILVDAIMLPERLNCASRS
jgi:hypothetical protein